MTSEFDFEDALTDPEHIVRAHAFSDAAEILTSQFSTVKVTVNHLTENQAIAFGLSLDELEEDGMWEMLEYADAADIRSTTEVELGITGRSDSIEDLTTWDQAIIRLAQQHGASESQSIPLGDNPLRKLIPLSARFEDFPLYTVSHDYIFRAQSGDEDQTQQNEDRQ